MDSLNHLSINLAIEVAKQKNIVALEDLFNCFSEIMNEDQLSFVFSETAEYLNENYPKVADWFKKELSMEEDFLELEEEVVLYITKHDIAHLLLDQNFIPEEDFRITKDKVAVNKAARQFLEEYYDIELLQPIICTFRKRKSKK